MGAGIAGPADRAAVKRPRETEFYIRIGELAREFDVTLRTLRFYEDKGLLQPKRRGMTRLYTERDRARLKLVLLGRRIGFPLRDVKQILDVYGSGTSMHQMKAFIEKAEKQMTWLEKQHAEVEEAMAELAGLIGDVRTRIARGAVPASDFSGRHVAPN
jgi:DNA-binding transcriptional MerR regulator